jgi:twitching motility protein PilT
MEELKLPMILKDLAMKQRGLILVTGPTGSGKSTTLASVIDYINMQRSCHILTLEDPIEYLHRHNLSMVNQREMGHDSFDFANALRAALRQDPDVILVGEMRDLETIAIAVTAAETGHLVLSTLHTVGAAKTIDRVIDVFPPHQQQQIRVQLASELEGVISQQLLPTADGVGRVAAFEVMTATPAIRNLIRENKTHQIQSVIQTGTKFGMKTMDSSLIELYKNGIVTQEMALDYSVDREYMEKTIGSSFY